MILDRDLSDVFPCVSDGSVVGGTAIIQDKHAKKPGEKKHSFVDIQYYCCWGQRSNSTSNIARLVPPRITRANNTELKHTRTLPSSQTCRFDRQSTTYCTAVTVYAPVYCCDPGSNVMPASKRDRSCPAWGTLL